MKDLLWRIPGITVCMWAAAACYAAAEGQSMWMKIPLWVSLLVWFFIATLFVKANFSMSAKAE